MRFPLSPCPLVGVYLVAGASRESPGSPDARITYFARSAELVGGSAGQKEQFTRRVITAVTRPSEPPWFDIEYVFVFVKRETCGSSAITTWPVPGSERFAAPALRFA